MKKVFKIFGIGFLVLMAITFASNIVASRLYLQQPVQTPKPTASGGVSVYQIADMISESCDQVFYRRYYTDLDEQNKIFRVYTWQDDLNADLIERTKQGNNEDVWNKLVSDIVSTANTMQSSFDELGHEEYTCVLNVCDPEDPDIIYLSIAQGVVGYDVVRGIDLMNNPEG